MDGQNRKVVLVIMDGWGISPPDKYNAIDNARTPNIDGLKEKYPNLVLKSDGLSVGLPEGHYGTSEVNHLTIGGGRVQMQDLTKINLAIQDGSFFQNPAIGETINHAEHWQSKLHLIGIMSDGGVHSHIDHLFAIFKLLSERDFKQPVCLHMFADGRDSATKSVRKYLDMLFAEIEKYPDLDIRLATLQGRFYLDRDRDWEKTMVAVNTMRGRNGERIANVDEIFSPEYEQLDTDQYLPCYLLDETATIADHDAIFVFNFRSDRSYQLVHKLYAENLQDMLMGCFVRPTEEFPQLREAFPRIDMNNTLAEVISTAGKRQFHIAETEKFTHVTYYFNGEREAELDAETWEKEESYRFVKPLYNFDPAMRNGEVTEQVISAINSGFDFVLVNLASTDMVGHTGTYEAAVVSTESVDYCVGKIYDAVAERLDEYVLIVTADHGNSDQMWDYENDQPHTQHTTAPVPFIVVNNLNLNLRDSDSLADIAPTITELMGLPTPEQMTGKSMLSQD